MKKTLIYVLTFFALMVMYAIIDYLTEGFISTGVHQYISIFVTITIGVLSVNYICDKLDL